MDVSWVWIFHTYVVPAYTYWYYFGPILLFAFPLLRLLLVLGKYLAKVFLMLYTEAEEFVTEAMKSGKEDEEDEYVEEEMPVSAERLILYAQRGAVLMGKVFLILLILSVPIWFAVSLPFIFYDNYAECHRIHLSHLNTVQECNEKGFIGAAFQDLCMQSDRESRKSIVHCSMSATVTDFQVYVWNTISSLPVILYLMFVILLAIVRSGLKTFVPTPTNENTFRREARVKMA